MLFPKPHTSSYYAASLGPATDYPELLGEQHADVCVIGAGFTGISTALHLAERGYNVHVVEANRIGWGASGRNGGQLIGGFSGEHVLARQHGIELSELLWQLRWAGHDIIRERVSNYNIQCDLKFGYLDVAIKPRHMADIETENQELEAHGFPHEHRVLSREETCELIGTDTYIGSLLNMGNGHLHPLKLCVGEARAAVSLGATIYEQSPVIEIKEGKKNTVVTQHGSVHADSVVIAGNAYHHLEKKMRGWVLPVNSFIIATEPLSQQLVEKINPKDLAVCDPNYILEYFRLTADKRLLFGGRCNYFGHDPAIIKKHLVPKMLRKYPILENTRIDYAWGGTIGVTVNRVPPLGRLSGSIFYAQGYSGHGVNFTHVSGQIMADAIAGTLERFDVFANIKPLVLPGSHPFTKPMVALGVLYYQVKDKF